MIRIMIDMETAATTENAAILTLGAMVFLKPSKEANEAFYELASLESNERVGRTIDLATMQWWDKQDPVMRAEAFSGTQNIGELLFNFQMWCTNLLSPEEKLEDIELWSRGAGFDCNILQHAYLNILGHYPFDFRKHMCQRTIERITPERIRAKYPEHKSKHDALADAIWQGRCTEISLSYLTWFSDSKD